MSRRSPVALLGELIRIPSVNPEGDPGVPDPGEERLAMYLQDYMVGLGAEVSVREVLPGRPNVVARFPSNRVGKPRLLLAPHTDTVSVAGMTIEPFSGEERDGKIWGRGASDTKGPMASMLTALTRARDFITGLDHEIWFAGLMGEESGQHGAKALALEEHFDFVIAGEPTDLQTVHAHKGSLWVTLQTHGRAVHASAPEQGENAIYAMTKAIEAIRSEIIPKLDRLTHPLLGRTSLSVGTIRGGSKTNIVPDHCEATIDIRLVPGVDALAVMDILQHVVGNVSPGTGFTYHSSTPLYTAPSHPLIEKLGSLNALPVGAPWFCDAAVFSAAGMPAIALGPGSITQAHTADEWIKVSDLEAGADFFEKFLRSLG